MKNNRMNFGGEGMIRITADTLLPPAQIKALEKENMTTAGYAVRTSNNETRTTVTIRRETFVNGDAV